MGKEFKEGPPEDVTREQLLDMYWRLRLIRGFEESAKERFEAGNCTLF